MTAGTLAEPAPSPVRVSDTLAAVAAIASVATLLAKPDARTALLLASGGGWWGTLTLLAGGLAVMTGLVFASRWPWLLVAGTVITAPATVLFLLPGSQFSASRSGLSLELLRAFDLGNIIGGGLLLIGALAAAQQLYQSGRVAAAAMVAGLTTAAGVFRTSTSFAPMVGLGNGGTLMLVLAGCGAAGAALAGIGAATGRIQLAAAAPPDRKLLLFGGLAVLLSFVPLLTATLFSSVGDAVVLFSVSGVLMVVAAVGITAALHLDGLLRLVSVALVLLGTSTPLLLGMSAIRSGSGTLGQEGGWLTALLGLGLGLAVALVRWRGWVAALCFLLLGAGLLVGASLAAGTPSLLGRHIDRIPGELLIILVVMGVTLAGASAAPGLAKRGSLPLVLGPLLSALVIGGQQVMYFVALNGRRGMPNSLSSSTGPLVETGILLLAATVALAAVAAIDLRRPQPAAVAPTASPADAPVTAAPPPAAPLADAPQAAPPTATPQPNAPLADTPQPNAPLADTPGATPPTAAPSATTSPADAPAAVPPPDTPRADTPRASADAPPTDAPQPTAPPTDAPAATPSTTAPPTDVPQPTASPADAPSATTPPADTAAAVPPPNASPAGAADEAVAPPAADDPPSPKADK